ncbi:MAG: PEP-utilizing enzyme [Actinomycetota bacterium]
MKTPTWEKPGPGTWEHDSSHSSGSPGPILRDLFEEGFGKGFAEGLALFGSPLKTLEMRWVNGKFYRRLVPLIGGGRDMKPPPPAALWLATRVHPAFRRQEKQAKESFETRRWRDELRRWEEEWKPRLVKQNLAFTDVDVASISDGDLIAHLQELHDYLRETLPLHFRLHVSDMGPLGDLMVHLEDWGLGRDDAFRALIAASPATRAPAAQLRRLADAVREAGVDPTAVTSLDEVRAASPEAAERLDDYLRFNGTRLTTGYDLEDRTLEELPEVVVSSIRGAATSTGHDADPTESLTALRDEVPAEHRATFDEVVEDARLSYGLRDENGPITYEWPAGLLRRGLREAGRRLVTAGRLATDTDVFELTLAEVTALLGSGEGPGLEEVAARAEERRWCATLEPPERLGPEEAPPPLAVMPPNLRRITRIVLTVVSAMEADKANEPLTGMGIGREPYVGTARVVHDASEALVSVEPGDIIVAPYTAPTYNAVLAMAGGVVTEEGGLLCHAAVLARELGLAAVIGATDAMSRIPDGATVEVDPVAGRVRVLS